MFRGLTRALSGQSSALKSSTPLPSLTPPTALFPSTNISALPVYPSHSIPFVSTTPLELLTWHDHARNSNYLSRPDHWAVIDALGIPSSGPGLKLAYLSSAALVKQGIPQITIQLLPFAPVVFVNLEDKGVLLTELLGPESYKLSDPEHTPYVLARSNNGTSFVGGVYMRLFKDREALVASNSVKKAEEKKEEESGFMKELGALVAKRLFAPKK